MKGTWILASVVVAATSLFTAFTFKREEAVGLTCKQLLLEELKKTHNTKDWFVPCNTAVEGLTPEQAMWKDNTGNHSVGQLTYHLVFWNERQLLSFKGTKPSDFSGNNDETFNSFDKASWETTVKKLDQVMLDLEKMVEGASDEQLKEWAPTITNICTHNAYHTGQIIYVRKEAGNWNPEKGVK